MNSIVPIVVATGFQEWPRFYIALAGLSGYWDAREQVAVLSPRDATLFADLDQANRESQQFQRKQYEGLPTRKFVAPIEIELFSDEHVSPEDLQKWLRKTVKFTIDYCAFGNGPTDTSLVLTSVNWGKFLEQKDATSIGN